MLDRVLADAVVVFHLAFIAFVLAGGVLVVGVQYCRSGRSELPRGGQ